MWGESVVEENYDGPIHGNQAPTSGHDTILPNGRLL